MLDQAALEPQNELPAKPELGRLCYSPSEVARAFGRNPATIYRAIYRGELQVLNYAGRIMIPSAEVQRFFESMVVYTPRKKAPRSKPKNQPTWE